MKQYYSLIIFLSLGLQLTAHAEDTPIDTEDRQSSYAAGVRYMESLLKDKLTLDIAAFTQGMQDVQAGRESKLTPEQTKKALDQIEGLRILSRKAMEDERIQEGSRFLEDNAKQADVQKLEGGLQYKILTAGTGKTSPGAEDGVSIRYSLNDIQGKELLASKPDAAPKLLVKMLIPAWQQALQHMKPGEKWQLFIPPNLAFDKHGSRDGRVKSSQTLIGQLELVAIVPADEAKTEMEKNREK